MEDMATINGTRAMDMEEDGVEEEEGGEKSLLRTEVFSVALNENNENKYNKRK